ncbi:MAG: WD40 repeat domain-containing protein [Planctomycetes bacterium]|nr:WD40 repeat domain-containing protein [Planctomycetota bacterium]
MPARELPDSGKRVASARTLGGILRLCAAATVLATAARVTRGEEAAQGWPAMDSLTALSPANADKIEPLGQVGTAAVDQLAWSPNSSFLALSSSSGVALYELEAEGGTKWSRRRVIKEKRSPTGISFGSRDSFIAVCDGGKSVKLWDVRSGWTRAELKDAGSRVVAMSLAPVGFLLAVATADGKLRIWQDESLEEPPKVLDDFERSTEGFLTPAEGMSLDPSGRWAVTWSGWRTVHVWDLKTDQRALELEVTDKEGFNVLEDAAIGPGATLWVSTYRSARRWRLPGEDELPELPRRLFSLNPWTFHPEGKLCLARGDKGPEIVAAVDGKSVRRLAPASRYGPAAFDRKGKWLALLSDDALSILDVRSGAATYQEKLGIPALVVAVAPGGGLLAWGPNLKGFQIVDLRKGAKSLKLPAEGEVAESTGAVAIDPKGRFVATSSWSSRKGVILTTGGYRGGGALPVLWQVTPGRLKRTGLLDGQLDGVRSLAFSPDGEWLALGTDWAEVPQVRLFSVRTGKVRSVVDLPRAGGFGSSVQEIAFDPKGKVLAAAVQGAAKLSLVDVAKGKLAGDMSLPQTARYSLTALSFGPQGSTVAVGTSVGQVLVYDVSTRKLRKTIELKDFLPQRVAFSPDGALVAATGHAWKRAAPGEVEPAGEGQAEEEEGLPTSLVLYEIATGSFVHSAPAHATRSTSLAFLQDGRAILTGAVDGTLRLWGVKGEAGEAKEVKGEKKPGKK